MDKTEAGVIINEARIVKGLRWKDLADSLDAPLIWTISAVQGEHPMSREQAQALADRLDLSAEVVEQLTRQPNRGAGAPSLPTDPTLYRFYEALMVYGPAIKEFIHEDFGDAHYERHQLQAGGPEGPGPWRGPGRHHLERQVPALPVGLSVVTAAAGRPQGRKPVRGSPPRVRAVESAAMA